jgi:hypothetical protein
MASQKRPLFCFSEGRRRPVTNIGVGVRSSLQFAGHTFALKHKFKRAAAREGNALEFDIARLDCSASDFFGVICNREGGAT